MSSALSRISIKIPNFDLAISCSSEDGPKVRRFLDLTKIMSLPENRDKEFPMPEITAYFREIMKNIDDQVKFYKTCVTSSRDSRAKVRLGAQRILNDTTLTVINATHKGIEAVYTECIRAISDLIEMRNTLDLEDPEYALFLENVQSNLATIDSISKFINKIYPFIEESDGSMEASGASRKDAAMSEVDILKELESEASSKRSTKSKKAKKSLKNVCCVKSFDTPITAIAGFEDGCRAPASVISATYCGSDVALRTSELPDTFRETVSKFYKLREDLRKSCTEFKKTFTVDPRVMLWTISTASGLAERKDEGKLLSYSDDETIEAHFFPEEMLPLMLSETFSCSITDWKSVTGDFHKRRQLIISVDGSVSILVATIDHEGNLYHFSSRPPRTVREAQLIENCIQNIENDSFEEGEFLIPLVKGIALNEQFNVQFTHRGRKIIVYQIPSARRK